MEMKTQLTGSRFYLSAIGSEAALFELDSTLNLIGSEIKAMRGLGSEAIAENGERNWLWRTCYHQCLTNIPEDEVLTYLNESGIVATLKANRPRLCQLSVILVNYPATVSEVRGCSIPTALIHILYDLNASFEFDLLPYALMDETHTNS